MDKDKILDEIFKNDPLGLLKVKPKITAQTADERLLAAFQEINDFVSQHKREPRPNAENISEYKLYSRLQSLREDQEKIKALRAHDIHHLLPSPFELNDLPRESYGPPPKISSIDDILNSDTLGILEDDAEDLFRFRHTPLEYERAQADFVAQRKPCKDFEKYEPLFKQVQKELAEGKRKLIPFKMGNLKAGNYYVHNGILFLLESVHFTRKAHYRKDGTRVREDGRTKCIFENGTVSNMMFRSVAKALYLNGKAVTQNIDKINEDFAHQFGKVSEKDEEAGYIYVLKSLSPDERIASIQHLYKIGYSKTEVSERIKNAAKDPTYLMAPVSIQSVWKCYNMNPQKLEQLLHNFFGSSCLEIDVFDEKGQRHSPREWFIAPLKVIEQAIQLIINGKVLNYKFDPENMTIVEK